MIGIRLEAVDTWFFRDGTPFLAGSAPQDDVGSSFPPHPASVAGALRAALALCNGWNGRGRWPVALDEVLGDGPGDLGMLSVDGPFLLRGDQPLFRAPRHLLGTVDADGWSPRACLRPGREVMCDLGDAVRLPEVPRAGSEFHDLETGDGWWLTRAGLESVLGGTFPSRTEVISSKELWSEEPRIGLERDRNTRTALEGGLYSTRHVRLMRGVSLGARVGGVPADWTLPFGRLVSLGGESRLAECREWHAEPALAVPKAEIEASGRVMIVALSPLDLERDVYTGRRPLGAIGNARVVSACLDRPQRIGGWDSLARRPLPLRCVLPPGSVLFCATAEPWRFIEAITGADGLARMGARQQWGFGLVALGNWSDEEEVSA